MAGEDVVVASESGEMIVDAKAEVEEVREEGEDEGAEGEGLGNGFPIARVKRIMRKNPDKKKQFSQDTVRAVCIATELFLDDIVKNSHEHTVAKKRKTMQLGDIAASIHSVPRYEFADGPGILPVVQDKKAPSRADQTTVVDSEPKDTVKENEDAQNVSQKQENEDAQAADEDEAKKPESETAEKGGGEGGGDAAPQEEADGKSGETQEEVEASKEDGMEEDVSKDGCGQ